MPTSARSNAAKNAATPTQPANIKVVGSNRPKPATPVSASKTKLSVVGPKSKEQFKLEIWATDALETVQTNVFLCDINANILYANQKSFETLTTMEPNLRIHSDAWRGFTASEIIGSSLESFFANEPLEYRRAIDPRNLPYHGRIKTGSCTCELQITGIRDNTGNLIGYSVNWDRITEKLSLELHATRIQEALDGSGTNMMIVDSDFKLIYMNRGSSKTFKEIESDLKKEYGPGFTAESLIGTSIDAFHKNPAHQRSLMSNESIFPFKTEIKVGPLTLQLNVNVIKDKVGKIIGYAAGWDDITERTATLRRANQLVQVLDESTANTLLCDLSWNVLFANKKSFEVLEFMEANLQAYDSRWRSFRAKDIIGKSLEWLFTDEPEKFRQATDPRNHPYKTQIKTGPCTCDVTVTSTHNEKGEAIGYAVYWERITEKLIMEAKIKSQLEDAEYINVKIEELRVILLAMASGDFTKTITVDRQDSIGILAGAVNEMADNVSKMVGDMQVIANRIAAVSADVAAGNEDLSQRTEEQASSLEETASSMEEMTSTVKQNADNARQANQLAGQARDVAEKGGSVVSRTVTSMEEINVASKRIADIISVIDEIAFQTNLLALNAAVEAARVGEQGRGFAVVATEVRSLAGRSATAAKEIKTLVQDSVAKVQDGSALVNQSGVQLEEIVSSVKKVADIISEITAASQEQATGIEQVNKAVIQMDQVTQQNAAVVEEAAASAIAMDQQTKDLQSLVNRFKINEQYVINAQANADKLQAATVEKQIVGAPKTVTKTPTRPAPKARFQSSFHKAEKDEFEEF